VKKAILVAIAQHAHIIKAAHSSSNLLLIHNNSKEPASTPHLSSCELCIIMGRSMSPKPLGPLLLHVVIILLHVFLILLV
jgi:hypothetical protein